MIQNARVVVVGETEGPQKCLAGATNCLPLKGISKARLEVG